MISVVLDTDLKLLFNISFVFALVARKSLSPVALTSLFLALHCVTAKAFKSCDRTSLGRGMTTLLPGVGFSKLMAVL
jgi:hypothetical protein